MKAERRLITFRKLKANCIDLDRWHKMTSGKSICMYDLDTARTPCTAKNCPIWKALEASK
jgi:hypothetical protein